MSGIEFQFETGRNFFTDLRYTRLSIRGRINEGDRTSLDSREETLLVNNEIHSLFSNCGICLNNEQVHSAISLYAHQAFGSAEFSGTNELKESLSQCQAYRYEIDSNDFIKRPFTDVLFKKGKDSFLRSVGSMTVCIQNLLLPNVNLRLKLIRLYPSFIMIDTVGNNMPHISIMKNFQMRLLFPQNGTSVHRR